MEINEEMRVIIGERIEDGQEFPIASSYIFHGDVTLRQGWAALLTRQEPGAKGILYTLITAQVVR